VRPAHEGGPTPRGFGQADGRAALWAVSGIEVVAVDAYTEKEGNVPGKILWEKFARMERSRDYSSSSSSSSSHASSSSPDMVWIF
jgi:hypothetical protein